MITTIRQTIEESKVCQQIDLGLLQEVLPCAMIEDLLETYQMWEERERKLNMVVLTYWLIALHVYPQLSQRAVYAKLVSGQRAWRDDVPQQIPAKSAFSYRREQLGSELLEELFAQVAGPKATQDTPGAFWHGMRRLSIDGTVESVPDTPSNREAFRYSIDDPEAHSPFPQARLVLLVECGTHLICDAELSACRQGEASSLRLLVQRWTLEQSLLWWESGFHSSWAIFEVCARGGQVLGRLKSNVLLTTLLDPFLYPALELAVLFHERWHAELVIGETRTVLRLSARTLRSLTPQGVIQELYALWLAHTLLRTLMLQAATQQGIAPTALSLTGTIRILDESLLPLGMVDAMRRHTMVVGLLEEIAQQRLPKQRVRIQARVVKRVRSRYAHKKPEHWLAPPLELDLDFHQIIALVT